MFTLFLSLKITNQTPSLHYTYGVANGFINNKTAIIFWQYKTGAQIVISIWNEMY